MDEKIKFISNNIDFISETDDIISFINYENINYSHNSNGFFINLSLLKKEHIDGIYKLVKEKIDDVPYENKTENIDIVKQNNYFNTSEKSIKLDNYLEKILKFNFA